ncbi:MAG TPA: gliding motility-associated protein GldE [Draconibacterium sp.]|nr:gliding motility-associated protein GldE [Draconibacterium sp.]
METDKLLSSSQSGIWNIQFEPFTIGDSFIIAVIFVLVAFSLLLSASEIACFSLNASDKQSLKKNNKTDDWILNNLQNPETLLATILTVNIFANIGIIVLLAEILDRLVSFQNLPVIDFIFKFVFIVVFLMFLGFVLPKMYASRINLKLIRFMAFPLKILEKLFRPLTRLIVLSTSVVNRQLQKYNNNFSLNEISPALHLTTEQELSEEKDILEGIVKFGNKNVSEIMKPRVDVVTLDIKTPFKSVLDLIVDSGFSRIPVYSASFDNIKGILYIKDLLPHSHKSGSFKWQSLIRPPFYVPETKKINSLLKEFQKNKVHLAVVIDEYGGTSGIVTLEDVLEEIVGEIVDEFDEEEHFYSKISANTFLFDGKTLLGDFYKITKSDDTVFEEVKGDADTLAGLILELKGEIPIQHERAEYKQFVFTIEAVSNRRIKQIKVEINRNYEG